MTRCTDCTRPGCTRDQGCDKSDPADSLRADMARWCHHADCGVVVRADVAALIAERDALRGEVLYLRVVLGGFAHEAQLSLDHRRGGMRAGTPHWVQVPPSVCASIITEVEHTRDPENLAYCGREITASMRQVEAERDNWKAIASAARPYVLEAAHLAYDGRPTADETEARRVLALYPEADHA